MRLNTLKGIKVLTGGLQWRVRPPVGKVKKEGAVLIGLNDLNRFVGPIIRQIATGLKFVGFARVISRREPHTRPEKFVDGVKGNPRVHHIRVVFRQIHTALHQQAVIKALLMRCHTIFATEVPFTNMGRVIALRFKRFCDGHL